jgi:hypothetical protein
MFFQNLKLEMVLKQIEACGRVAVADKANTVANGLLGS